jgi:uncharacterized alkaline shock family protein YloU
MTGAATEQTSTRSTSGANPPGPSATVATTRGGSGCDALASSQGRTSVADTVVQKIAGRAAREVSGVHDFGGGASRTFGAITERIPGGRASSSRGVTVEVGDKQAAIDLDIVVQYGVAIGQLAQSIRRNVIGAVEQMSGLEVVEVNINVNDLHLPEEDRNDESSEPPRVT